MVDGETLAPAKSLDAPVLMAIAARVGKTRLIDNVALSRQGKLSVGSPPSPRLQLLLISESATLQDYYRRRRS